MKYQSQFTGEQIDQLLRTMQEWQNIEYDKDLAFDTSELVVPTTTVSTDSAILGQAVLGQLILA